MAGWPGQFHHTQVVCSTADRTEPCAAARPERFLSDALCSGGLKGIFICSSIAFVPMFSETVVKKQTPLEKNCFQQRS